MRLAIDANRYTDLCRGISEVVDVVEKADEVWVPLIVVAELRAGFAFGTRRDENERVLLKFLATPGVGVLSPDDATTLHYAELYAYLRKRGTPVPTNDLWIAALAVQHGLPLFDRDSDFDRLPQVRRIRVSGQGAPSGAMSSEDTGREQHVPVRRHQSATHLSRR